MPLVAALPVGAGCGPTAQPAAPVPVAVADPEPAVTAENPVYKSWAAFKPGTAVTYRSVTEAADHPGGQTVTTTTYTLVDLTPDRAVVEMKAHTRKYDGEVIDTPSERLANPRVVRLPPGADPAGFGKPAPGGDQGEEAVAVAGGTYKARWHTGKSANEAGEVLSRTWVADGVPTGLVKSVIRIPAVGKTTTLELVEVRLP